jgi:hypothetical protein
MASDNKKPLTGPELFALPIAGDWNKSAVKQISDGVMAGVATELSLDDLNWVSRLSDALLIRGSLVIVDREVSPGAVLYVERLRDVESSASREIAYTVRTSRHVTTLRRWLKGPTTVIVETYPDPPEFKSLEECREWVEAATAVDSVTISAAGVMFIDNRRGILVPAAATLKRLAELSDMLSETIGPDALLWFVDNYAADIRQLNSAARTGGHFGTIPDGSKFHHMYDSGFSNDIFKQMEMLIPAYKTTVSNFTIVPGESGIARFIGLLGYMNVVRHTQAIIAHVMSEYGIIITWDNLIFSALRGEIEQQPTGGVNPSGLPGPKTEGQ